MEKYIKIDVTNTPKWEQENLIQYLKDAFWSFEEKLENKE